MKEKLIHVDNALQRPRVAHHDYSSEILDEDGIAECQLYLESEERKLGLIPLADRRLDNCDCGEIPSRIASSGFSCKT